MLRLLSLIVLTLVPFGAPLAPASAAPCTDAASVGFVGDDATDNTAAWNAWISGLPAGTSPCLVGDANSVYKFNSGIAVTLSRATPNDQVFSLFGAGSESTVFDFGSTGTGLNIANDASGEFHIRGLSFWTSGAGVASGIAVSAPNGVTNYRHSDITDVTVRAPVSGYWADAVALTNQSQVTIKDFIFENATDALSISGGNELPGSASVSLRDGSISGLTCGVCIGNYVQTVAIDDVTFNGGNQVIVTGPTFYQLAISNSVFSGIIPGAGQTNGDDIHISGGGGVQISNNLIYANEDYSGIYAANLAGATIIGNVIRGYGGVNGNYGINIASTAGGIPATMTGNVFSALGMGWYLGTATAKINVQSNIYGGNSTNYVNDGGSGNTIGGGSP